MFPTLPGMTWSLAKVNKSFVAHFLDSFSVILRFLDVPKYSDMFDYIKGKWPAVYFKNQKKSLRIIFNENGDLCEKLNNIVLLKLKNKFILINGCVH